MNLDFEVMELDNIRFSFDELLSYYHLLEKEFQNFMARKKHFHKQQCAGAQPTKSTQADQSTKETDVTTTSDTLWAHKQASRNQAKEPKRQITDYHGKPQKINMPWINHCSKIQTGA